MMNENTNAQIDDEEGELPPDRVADEDSGRDESDVKPWDPSKIRISTKNFSLRDVVDQIADGELFLAPDFQRDYVWKQRQRTRLVESILLGIPLPAFYFNQDVDGRYQVVDGVQRLSTISLFMRDGHALDEVDLEYLKQLHGLAYSQLDPASVRRFRSTQIVVHVIEPQTPDEVKYDIFGRVNTLGSPLSAQEIRHAMSKDRSRSFLKNLAESEAFDRATQWSFWRREAGQRVRYSGRMANRELVLRYCAFRHHADEDYRKHSSMDAFLVEYTRRLDLCSEKGNDASEAVLRTLSDDFHRSMDNAYQVLGNAAFRRWPLGQQRRGPINRAVFESQAIALADYRLDDLLAKRDAVLSALRGLFSETDYSRAVTVGTGDPIAVQRRLERPRQALAEIMR